MTTTKIIPRRWRYPIAGQNATALRCCAPACDRDILSWAGREFEMSGKNWDRVPIDAQSVDAPLSTAAVFLVVTVTNERPALAKVASVRGALDDLVKTVGFRDLGGRLSCIAGIGRDLWDRLHSDRRPRELKAFASISGTVHA